MSAMASAATAMLVSRATCAGEAVPALPAAMFDADADPDATVEVDAAGASPGAEVTAIDVDGVDAVAIGVRVGGTEKAEKLASSSACPRQRVSGRGRPAHGRLRSRFSHGRVERSSRPLCRALTERDRQLEGRARG